MAEMLEVNVFAYDYKGYGLTKGKPSDFGMIKYC